MEPKSTMLAFQWIWSHHPKSSWVLTLGEIIMAVTSHESFSPQNPFIYVIKMYSGRASTIRSLPDSFQCLQNLNIWCTVWKKVLFVQKNVVLEEIQPQNGFYLVFNSEQLLSHSARSLYRLIFECRLNFVLHITKGLTRWCSMWPLMTHSDMKPTTGYSKLMRLIIMVWVGYRNSGDTDNFTCFQTN